MKAEYRKGCSQRDNVEREGYARARSIDSREGMETDGVGGTLGSILRRDNLNRAYKRVRSNKGAAGVDGMTTQQALPWLKEHREELLQSLGEGKYKPEPVRRKEIPKPDGGVRKLGIPTVIDRMIQQAIAQVISPRFVVFARSKRAAERLLESCKRFLEKKLLLKVNTDKSCTTTVYSKRFKFLSFMLGKNKDGVYVRVHPKALRKCKQKLKVLTRRNRGRSVRDIMEQIKVYIRGWLGYFYIAKMKRTLQNWEEWLRRRLRMYIWKQWKKPRTKVKALQKLGIPPDKAYEWGNTRLGYWRVAHSPILQRSITNERLVAAGYYEISVQYERLRKLHLCD